MFLGVLSTADAQLPAGVGENLGGILEQPARRRPTLPPFEQATPTPVFVLPPVPALSEEEAGKVPGLARVFVKAFEFNGNTVFSNAELAEVVKPYTDRIITYEDLEAARYALTKHYIDHGYVTSGAVVPDQAISDGIITIQIVEGRLTQIDIEGNRWFRARYLRSRLALYAGPPVNIQDLQQGLQLLQANPLIKRINAELQPGLTRGEATLRVRVEDAVPYTLSLAFNNYQSPSVGSEQGVINAAHENLTGNGDTLFVRYGITSGVNDIGAGYTLPVTARDTTVGLGYRHTGNTVVEAPFDRLDITSTLDTYGITLRQPFHRSVSEEIAPALTFEYRRSETFLLGQPFSFSPGAQSGLSAVSVLRFAPEWTWRSATQVLAARSRFSWGLPIFGATDNAGPTPNGRFFVWLGQFQWARRLGLWDAESLVRTDIQLTANPLLSLEQFAVGGNQSVRGYRENQLVNDNGADGSVEVRVPVWHDRHGQPLVQLAPFSDVGGAWATRGHTPDPKYLASVGLGVRWAIMQDINFQLYWGYALKNVHNTGNDLEDYGIQFQLAADFRSPERIADTLPPWRETHPTVAR